MKALPVGKLPEGDWLYEIKFDGYRALAFKDGKDVCLVSRNKKAFDYPQLLDALKKLPADRVILDGEIAALDEKGRSSFQLLQMFKSSGDVPLVYYVFDLLSLEGKDLRQILSYEELWLHNRRTSRLVRSDATDCALRSGLYARLCSKWHVRVNGYAQHSRESRPT